MTKIASRGPALSNFVYACGAQLHREQRSDLNKDKKQHFENSVSFTAGFECQDAKESEKKKQEMRNTK